MVLLLSSSTVPNSGSRLGPDSDPVHCFDFSISSPPVCIVVIPIWFSLSLVFRCCSWSILSSWFCRLHHVDVHCLHPGFHLDLDLEFLLRFRSSLFVLHLYAHLVLRSFSLLMFIVFIPVLILIFIVFRFVILILILILNLLMLFQAPPRR